MVSEHVQGEGDLKHWIAEEEARIRAEKQDKLKTKRKVETVLHDQEYLKALRNIRGDANASNGVDGSASNSNNGSNGVDGNLGANQSMNQNKVSKNVNLSIDVVYSKKPQNSAFDNSDSDSIANQSKLFNDSNLYSKSIHPNSVSTDNQMNGSDYAGVGNNPVKNFGEDGIGTSSTKNSNADPNGKNSNTLPDTNSGNKNNTNNKNNKNNTNNTNNTNTDSSGSNNTKSNNNGNNGNNGNGLGDQSQKKDNNSSNNSSNKNITNGNSNSNSNSKQYSN
mmetsp:Transcript_44804/g.97908  ORF Transcript_44804/g.97908 Transcript_44804/m.97908 type:complete len:278 (+) Transcript_44804:332-1165(+)|eukprot:CAMPEP_0116979828 /NCGR_PEP_ID=MMETSP0467-20121206/58704_1 /TAXON_ID=283647 /ORGANISM="Mesodinium pulex, Strain SPMC105" /LENGTH=277 /DNA_ID=CAMNT_0004673653 /DNA_START=312 /DNA_END=1145 /DNA_ORIENTATION=-